ncbi:hypothetical protein ONA91_08855 [Micromonospora sp. DR5-3]|uniref:hypothetical protein n=1 Tax=unclassified Micromonospora TaxID=2617518 RepID=UPI0011D5F4E7|nr:MULTISPECIES: hypothetical protein [unclassified Micromonospora]MCW3814566.1 hypothetical protein [Micromonospora sp. DR5-3]TYC23259.1 hypothetical protein FXF52_16430 [Micromonospora sp. MP36]
MDRGELVRELATLPALEIQTSGSELHVAVPAIDDGLRLHPDAVLRVRRIFSPRGEPALELVVRHDDGLQPLIVLNDDVVWRPVDPDSQLDSAIPVRIEDMPPLVAYTEMERNGVGSARAIDQPTVDVSGLSATLLLQRCIIVGAMRFGLRPVRAAAWWRHLSSRLGDDFCLGRFRPDREWDGLVEEASRVRLLLPAEPTARDAQAEIADLTVADLTALEPALTAARADEEFLATWRRWVPVSPRRFHELIAAGLPEARIEVSLYPDGGCGVDLRIAPNDTLHALLALRISFPERRAWLDEIRLTDAATGTGLFQRLLFNTEELSRALGCDSIELLATGVGAYALARYGGYPRDPEV